MPETRQYAGDPDGPPSFSFLDAARGWISWGAADEPKMIHTRNGGRHWQDLSDQFLQKVHFFDDSHGDGAVVTNFLRTSDGGLSWTTAKIPHVRFIDRILFLTPDIGWLAGADGKDFIAFRTINGGRDWEESRTAAPKGIVLVRDLFFLDRERGWLIT